MRSGQAVVEILIAFGIALVAVLGLVGVATRSVVSSGVAKRQAQASAYATAAVEWVRNTKSAMGWEEFKNDYGQGNYCYGFGGTGSLTADGDGCAIGSEYNIVVTVGTSGTEEVTVDVVVSWQEGDRTSSARQSTRLVNVK